MGGPGVGGGWSTGSWETSTPCRHREGLSLFEKGCEEPWEDSRQGSDGIRQFWPRGGLRPLGCFCEAGREGKGSRWGLLTSGWTHRRPSEYFLGWGEEGQGFSTWTPSTFRATQFSVHCRMFYSIPGLYPLDAGSTHPRPVVTTKDVSRYCQISSEKCEIDPPLPHRLRTTEADWSGNKKSRCFSKCGSQTSSSSSRELVRHANY